VQATLLALTATSIADEINKQKMPKGAQVIVCGGGAFNPLLMQRMTGLLPSYQVSDSHSINIHPQHVEGAAFAWLAFAHPLRERRYWVFFALHAKSTFNETFSQPSVFISHITITFSIKNASKGWHF